MSAVLEHEAPTTENPVGAETIDGSATRDRRRRAVRRVVAAVVVVGVIGAAGVLINARRAPATTPAPAARPTVTAAMKTITDDASFDGTIGFAPALPVVARVGGRATMLAPEGSVVPPGGVLFAIDEHPVWLMTGALPAWRDLGPATTTGPDVQQLNESLIALGYDPDKAIVPDQTFSTATAAAVVRWQESVGLSPTGTIPLGTIVFEPGPVTVGHQDVSVGSAVGAGTTVIETRAGGLTMQFTLPATSTVSITVGQKVDVTLPDRSTGQGTITSIGTVTDATTGAVSTVGRGPVIPAPARANGGQAAEPADQAPIKVRVSQVIGNNVLTVPAQALNARSDGSWIVSVVDGTTTRDVPVRVGVSGGGVVAVTGEGITTGTKVLIPSPN